MLCAVALSAIAVISLIYAEVSLPFKFADRPSIDKNFVLQVYTVAEVAETLVVVFHFLLSLLLLLAFAQSRWLAAEMAVISLSL